MPFRLFRFESLLAFTILLSWMSVTFGQSGSLDRDYPRGPMRASEVVRQPIRVAQFDPNVGQPPPSEFGMTPVPSNNFGTTPGPPAAVDPNLGPTPFSGQLPPNPNFGFNPGPNANANPGFNPYAAPTNPNLNSPNFAPPSFNGQNSYGGYGVPNPNANSNIFGNSDLFRTPYDEVSPFGRQPLSPYGQTDFSEDVVDADLLIGLTPSRRTLNYGAGVGFNSDLGLFGQFIYDDRDFDWRAFPWLNPPVPFRGGGQRLRIEAMPGANAQRYLASFTEPYFAQ